MENVLFDNPLSCGSFNCQEVDTKDGACILLSARSSRHVVDGVASLGWIDCTGTLPERISLSTTPASGSIITQRIVACSTSVVPAYIEPSHQDKNSTKILRILQRLQDGRLQVQLQDWQTQHTQLTMCCSTHVARACCVMFT